MLVFRHWNAKLVSFLSIQHLALPFTNLAELMQDPSYTIALIPNSAHEEDFKFSSDALWLQAYQDRIRPNLDKYQGKRYMVPFIEEDPTVALYDNYFAIV